MALLGESEKGAPPVPDLDPHYSLVSKALADGRVVPLLGAGVNLCGRPAETKWQPGQSRFLPSGGELSDYLARKFEYPEPDKYDLLRVSQYVGVLSGLGPLYGELRALLNADYPPTTMHEFLASLPRLLRAAGLPPRYQLIVTTNYDDVMERAFEAAGQAYEVVVYLANGDERGKFLHLRPDAEPVLIERPNEYRDLSLDRRPVILKLHGAINRANEERDSFVITEDDYIDYLTRTDISNLVPVTLAAKLRKSHFLFLGYSLRDWNLRVILHRIWGEQKLSWRSWAVQRNPSALEREIWKARGVDVFDVRLEDYVAGLTEKLQPAVPAAVVPQTQSAGV